MLQSHLSQPALARVSVYQCRINDTWARDHGPITLIASDAAKRNKILNFKFNGWGEKFRWEDDNTITRQLYAQGVFDCDWDDNTDFVLEGGSIESDGKGTILTSSQCLLAPHRNQPLTKEDIETQLKKRLCADRILWVDHGNLKGDDTDGHIDTIVRMAPDHTLLYITCDNPQDEQYTDLKSLEAHFPSTTVRTDFRLLMPTLSSSTGLSSFPLISSLIVTQQPCLLLVKHSPVMMSLALMLALLFASMDHYTV